MKTLLRATLVVALTVGFLALWLRNVDLAAMGSALADARLLPVLGVIATTLLHVVIRAIRWRVLLDASGDEAEAPEDDAGLPPDGGADATLGNLVSYTFLGYTVTFVAPGRLGEVVRPALLWTRHPVPAGLALSSVVFERLLDLCVIVGFLLAFIALEPGVAGPRLGEAAAWAGAVMVTAGGALVYLHVRRREWLERVIRWLASRLPERLGAGFERLGITALSGFDALHQPGAWWRLPLLSIATWTPVALGLYLALVATGIDASPSAALLLVPLTAAGITVPTPAGVGSYHAAFSWGLTEVLGAGEARAAAAAVVAHAASILPVIAAGLYCLWREGLGVSSLRSVAREARVGESAS